MTTSDGGLERRHRQSPGLNWLPEWLASWTRTRYLTDEEAAYVGEVCWDSDVGRRTQAVVNGQVARAIRSRPWVYSALVLYLLYFASSLLLVSGRQAEGWLGYVPFVSVPAEEGWRAVVPLVLAALALASMLKAADVRGLPAEPHQRNDRIVMVDAARALGDIRLLTADPRDASLGKLAARSTQRLARSFRRYSKGVRRGPMRAERERQVRRAEFAVEEIERHLGCGDAACISALAADVARILARVEAGSWQQVGNLQGEAATAPRVSRFAWIRRPIGYAWAFLRWAIPLLIPIALGLYAGQGS